LSKILAVLLWPAGIAVIFCAVALLARRLPRVTPTGPGSPARSALLLFIAAVRLITGPIGLPPLAAVPSSVSALRGGEYVRDLP
jgi:hypothetical protein